MTGQTPHEQETGSQEPAERRSWMRSRPILVYLFLLAVVVAVPALIATTLLLQRINQAQQTVVRNLTDATVQAIGQSVDRELSGMVTTLRVLSTSTSLLDRDLPEFHARSVDALAGSGAYLIAMDADFRQLLNTRVPYEGPLGITTDRRSADLAMERRIATVSDLFFGQVAQQWVFSVMLPLEGRTDVILLALTQNAVNLSLALQSRELPTGWHAALVDGSNLVIAATQEAGLETGSVLPMRQTLSDMPQEWRRERFDGDSVVTSEWRSGLSGWRVIAWASETVVDRPLWDTLMWLVAWGALLLAASAGLALWIARQIGASVRGLRRDAQRLGRGERVAAKAYPVAEIAEVSRALEDASIKRQAAEQEVNFLMREVAHRSKNQMTVIAAMAKQTARGVDDLPAYVQAFEKRILGLARSTDLLLAHGSAGVALRDLIDSHIAPFLPPDASRVRITGPHVRLNMQAAQILGMAAHELATNAVKYGAFLGEAGRLNVSWVVTADRLDFVWRETVAGPMPAGERVGFGTTVLKSMVGRSLGAEVERTCHPDGIEWHFAIPLSAIAPDRAELPGEEALDE